MSDTRFSAKVGGILINDDIKSLKCGDDIILLLLLWRTLYMIKMKTVQSTIEQ